MIKIEDIHELWGKDVEIDGANLDGESLKIPKLHHKYYQLYSTERLRLRQQKSDLAKLLLDKYEFYTQGPDKEKGPTPQQIEEGWSLPARGKIILKTEVDRYLEADKQIIDMNLRIAYTQEKIDMLKSILDDINRRSFNIGNAIAFRKFVNGVGG